MKKLLVHHLIAGLFLIIAVAGCAAQKQTTAAPTRPVKLLPEREMNEEAYHHFTNGVIYEQEGMVEEAAHEYEQALTYEPLSFDIRMALGQLYLGMNRPAQALDTFLPIADKTADTHRLIGDCFRSLRQDAEAENAYRRAWATDSANVALNYQLGAYAARANRIDEAAKYLRNAAALSGNTELFVQIAQMYADLKLYDSAAVVIESALRQNPKDAGLFSALAVYQYSAGKAEAAKEALKRGIAVDSSNARLIAQLIESYNAEDNLDSLRYYGEKLLALDAPEPLVIERIGIVMMRADQKDLAETLYRKLLDRDPVNRYALFYLGRIEIERKQWAPALGYFNRLVAVDSTMPDGWTNLALIRQQQQLPDSALKTLEAAMAVVKEERSNVQLFYAQLLSQSNRSDSAITILNNVLAEGGDSIRALFQLGAEYEKQGEFDRAVESFAAVLKTDPDNHQALNFLGYMLADKGVRLEEALAMIEKAVKAEPENGAYLDSFAWVLYRLGRYDEALIQIQKAIKLTNNDPIVIEHLGDIQYALGNLESARDAWKTVLALDPNNKTVPDKLRRQ